MLAVVLVNYISTQQLQTIFKSPFVQYSDSFLLTLFTFSLVKLLVIFGLRSILYFSSHHQRLITMVDGDVGGGDNGGGDGGYG